MSGSSLGNWTDERVEQLKRLHAEGHSASEIAKALGGITRNAAIGKCVRLGLGPIGGGKASAPMRAREGHQTLGRPVAPAKPKQPAPKGVMILNPVKGGDVTTAARVENMAARANPAENVVVMSRGFTPLPGQAPVPFGSKGCRWPVGGDGAGMMCCGAPRAEGERGELPYCGAHAGVAYQAVKPGAKSANELMRSLRRHVG